jgi:hypothetical protein
LGKGEEPSARLKLMPMGDGGGDGGEGRLGIRQLPIPPVVAMLLNQPASLRQRPVVAKEARAGELNVRLKQRHRSPLGDLPRFVQVRPGTGSVTGKATLPGTGQEATREVSNLP